MTKEELLKELLEILDDAYYCGTAKGSEYSCGLDTDSPRTIEEAKKFLNKVLAEYK